MVSMAEVSFDVVEQILVLLDVKDLIRSKSVCKSWYYSISSLPFVKAHLKRSYDTDRNNPELGHRRIGDLIKAGKDTWKFSNSLFVVGSFNGLVCICPQDAEFVVTNPSTREFRNLPRPPFRPDMRWVKRIREVVCWGFGYDSSADDYKVIAGFREYVFKAQTLFYVFSLKSNCWKFIGEVKYRCHDGVTGMLCGGSLHWFMSDANKRVIISLDLSTEKFKETPQPKDEEYESHKDHLCYSKHRCDHYKLGILEECLWIYSFDFSSKKWVMKNNNWKPYDEDHFGSKYDVNHSICVSKDSPKIWYTHNVGLRVRRRSPKDYFLNVNSIRASIFVKSLVSPRCRPYAQNNTNYDMGNVTLPRDEEDLSFAFIAAGLEFVECSN